MELPRRRLETLVERAFGAPMDACLPLPGGASTRRYFRISTARGGAIAMFAPDGARPEEVSSGAATTRWPFLEVRDLLAAHGVRVPDVLGEDCAAGLLLLEDLGDVTLAEALRRDPARRRALYLRAARDLAKIHDALAAPPRDHVVASRAFDFALLRWELQHFVEWGLDARDVVRTEAAKKELDLAFDAIARALADRPRGFVHRDYQSRNLMVDPRDEGALVVIDFQDALMGPRTYDLVALVRDSYQDLDEPFVDEVFAAYADARGLSADERADWRAEIDRLTVQRKLKDAGRFVFIERKKGDPSFLPYFAPSLVRVRGALSRLAHDPLFAKTRTLLAEALPDHFG